MKKKIIASILLFSVVALCSCDMSKTLETKTTETTEVTEETEITEATTEATAKVTIVEPDIEPSESDLKVLPIEDPVELDPFKDPAEVDPEEFSNQFLRDYIIAYKDDPNIIIVPVVGDLRSEDEIEQGIVEAILVRRAGMVSTNIYIQFDTVENAKSYLEYLIESMTRSGIIDYDPQLKLTEFDTEYEIDGIYISLTSDAFLTLRTW